MLVPMAHALVTLSELLQMWKKAGSKPIMLTLSFVSSFAISNYNA